MARLSRPKFQLARAIIALRAAKDLPTLPALARLAAAIRARVEVRFVDRKNRELRRVPPIRVGHKPVMASHERVR